jgi:hypothetical protein
VGVRIAHRRTGARDQIDPLRAEAWIPVVIDDRLGALLSDIARGMREGRDAHDAERWVERTRGLDQDIADAWAVFRQARESGRLNLRRTAAARVDASHALVPLLARLEQAVTDSRITRVREDLETMAHGLFAAGAGTTPRPVHGALIVNLRNILEAMDAVADAQPVRVRARPAAAVRWRRRRIAWRGQE